LVEHLIGMRFPYSIFFNRWDRQEWKGNPPPGEI
jgi:hypothetical protein